MAASSSDGGFGPRTRARSVRRGRDAAIVAAALAAACATRDVSTTPFRLEAVVVSTGASLADGVTASGTLIRLSGTGTKIDDTTFEVGDATFGVVRLRFDGTAIPGLAFPDRLGGQAVLVDVFIEPGQPSPSGGEVLPIAGIRIGTDPAAPTYDLVLGESSRGSADGRPSVPYVLLPVLGNEDLPQMQLDVDFRDYEPARCGPVYLATLAVDFVDRTVGLQRGEQTAAVVGTRSAPLHVLNVISYERRGTCSGQSESWTQIAAWR